jgi:O-antigen/teichoic acid export membrane protein
LKPFQLNGMFQPIESGERLNRTAVRGAAASVAGQSAMFALQLGSVITLARLLTPPDFGVVTMVTTFSLLFQSFGQNGFTELIIQREELSDSLASNLFWINLGVGTFLTLAFASAGQLLAMFYHNGAVAHVAECMSLTIVLGSLGYIHLALLQRAMHFRATAIINLVAVAVLVAVSISLALAGWHYWSLVWGIVAQSATTAAGAWLVCRWTPSRPRRVSGTASGLKFALNVYSHFAFNYLTRNTDNLLVGWRFGARTLGFYKKAYDLFVLAATQLLSPITAVAVSTLSRVSSDREQYQRYFLRAISVLALLGMGIGADFVLVGKDFIRVLLGPGWEEAGRIFTLFGPGIGVMLLYNTHGWIHLSIGRPERWLRWGLIEFLCTASLFLLALRWGPSGVALAWTTSYFLLMFPGFWYAGKPIGLRIGPIFSVVWKFFAAAATAGFATVMVIRAIYHSAPAFGALGAFGRIVSVSAIFFALYFCGVVALHRGLKPLSETVSLLRHLFPEPAVGPTSSTHANTDETPAIPILSKKAKPQAESVVFSGNTGSKTQRPEME